MVKVMGPTKFFKHMIPIVTVKDHSMNLYNGLETIRISITNHQ
jgi:hypothetical protein